ncbi:MAG: hypothetical protein ACK5JD_10995 [Mangrovibacterium sp.]
MKYKVGIILRNLGYNGARSKTLIFPATQHGTEMVVIKRLVLIPAADYDGYEDYTRLRTFRDRVLASKELVFYTKSFDFLIKSFLEANNRKLI